MLGDATMNTSSASRSVILRRGWLLRVDARPGAGMRCIRGLIWLTQESDPVDRIVAAGESFCFDRSGIALANALGTEAAVEFSADVTYAHAAPSPRMAPASVCEEILRIGAGYDPKVVAQLAPGKRRALVEQEARRMRSQVLWLLGQAARERTARALAAAWRFMRSLFAQWRPGAARKTRPSQMPNGL
jgi:hypothetical protein